MDPQTTSPTPHKKSTNMRTLLLVVLILVGAAFLYGSFIAPGAKKDSMMGESAPKEEKTYTITMSSGGNDVVGYDVILSYDPKMVTVGTVKSLDPQFQVVQSNAKEGMVAVTAIKLPSAQGSSVFENKAVLTIPVTQVKGQKDAVRIVQELENNTTKLINKDNQKVYLSDDMVRIAPNQ